MQVDEAEHGLLISGVTGHLFTKLVNKKAELVRVYLPPDANTLLSTMDHCLRTRDYVNVVVAGEQPGPQWLTMDEPVAHCVRGVGVGLGEHRRRIRARRGARLRRRRAQPWRRSSRPICCAATFRGSTCGWSMWST